MDAPLTLAGLITEFSTLVKEQDFEGAEELLTLGLGLFPNNEPFIHFQFGRLYASWNKLTSAINHLHRAVDLSQARNDEVLHIQANEELRQVRDRQAAQRP